MKAKKTAPRAVTLQEIEMAAEALRRALSAVRHCLDRDERKARAAAALAAERALEELGGVRLLDPRGARPVVSIFGRDAEGRAGRVDREGYGASARGVALDNVRSLTPGQARTGRAFAALSELAATAGGGGPQLSERVDVSGAGGGGRLLVAIEAAALVREAEAVALSLGDIVARYGSAAAPETLRGWVEDFLRSDASGGRRPIGRLGLMRGVCVLNLTLDRLLLGAGWAANNRSRAALGEALGATLDSVAEAWGGREARIVGRMDARIAISG